MYFYAYKIIKPLFADFVANKLRIIYTLLHTSLWFIPLHLFYFIFLLYFPLLCVAL